MCQFQRQQRPIDNKRVQAGNKQVQAAPNNDELKFEIKTNPPHQESFQNDNDSDKLREIVANSTRKLIYEDEIES